MLEAVYLAWSLRDTPGGEYMRQAREHGLPAGGFVSLTERKSIVDWLRRAIPSLDSIVPLSGELLFPLSGCCFAAHTIEESTTPPGTPPPSAYRRLHCTVCFECTCAAVDTHVQAVPVETPRRIRRLLNGATFPTLRMWRS
jgi:hypothetical protein